MRGVPRARCERLDHRGWPADRLYSWCGHGRPAHDARGPSAARLTGQPPSAVADSSTLLVYVMDIYDPGSYAYLPSVSTVLTAACSLVDVEVVQSGRYATNEAAAAVVALLATEELPVSAVLGAVQHEFFVNGRTLEAPGVLSDVSAVLGLDGPAIELFAATDRARELATEDFDLALDLDRKGGPLLLASRGERIFEFDGLGATGERLVDQFRSVLARP